MSFKLLDILMDFAKVIEYLYSLKLEDEFYYKDYLVIVTSKVPLKPEQKK